MRSIRKNRLIMFSIIFLVVISLTIGFSAFQKQLLIDDAIFNVRLQKDTRVSGIVLSGNGGSAESSYEEYNVSKIYGSVDFQSTSSYVLYKVSLTNYGNVKTGLLNITSNTSGVSYEICNSSGGSCTSNPKTAVCSGSNCTLGSTKDIYVKVKSSSAGTKTIDLDFDFEPYNDITYSNIRENTSAFPQEIMTHDSLSLTLTSKPEEVEVSGTASFTYNKNTGVLNISNVGSDLNISAKYSSSDVAEDHYTGSNPDNYVMLGDELYRIVTKENVSDGFGNTDLRVKLIKETSIGNNQFDGLSNEFNGSSISTVLNGTYYDGMKSEAHNLIETVAWTENATSYIGLINSTDYTSNSSWIPKEGYTLTKAEDNKIVAITDSGLTDSITTTSRATYPALYLKESVLITSGEGTKTNPFILELAGTGLRTNPTIITGNTLTVTGSNQSLVTVTNQVGSPRYSLDTPLNASNYTSGTQTIPTRSASGEYVIYFYIPEFNDGTNGYKAKAGSVPARINPLSFIVNYTKGANVASIGKNGDSCTTSGSSTSCNVTLPSITPNPGNENGKWNYSGNQYNPGSSFTLNSSKNGITLTATASGSTYTATFNKNGATSIGSTTLTCTVTEGSTCTVTAPSITREGYSTHGWGESASAHSGVTGAITLSGNKTFYAVTSKDVTITFNKNGNTGQIKNGGTQSNATTITDTCTIWNTATSCNITSPEIVMAGYEKLGYSTGATTYSNYWNQKTAKAVSADATWYAQTAIAEKTVTITFNKNGNTSQTPKNGSASTATTVSESCTIAAARNGESQATTCSITSPTINMSGFTIIGYSNASDNHTSSWNQNTAKEVSANATYFAQSSKASIDRTITFYKNGNTSFTYKGSAYTDTSKSFTACTIPAVYNGDAQSSSCTATITMPTISAPSGFTALGWSSASDEHNVTYTSGQSNVSLTMDANKSYYAQSSKAAINRTITFYKNGNTSFRYNGTTYTDTSKTFTACTIAAAYNGESQGTSCTATVNMPTITAATNFTNIGWSNAENTHTADYTSGQTNVSLTMTSNKSFYAQSSRAGINRTITFYKNGNTAFTYNGTRYTDESKSFTACTTPTVYNGEAQSTTCNATITMPTIEAASGFTVVGWSGASGTHTATYTSGQANVSITMNANKSFYAQSKKNSVDRTITFYRNGNTSFTYNGTTYTDTSKTFTACTIPVAYNGDTQSNSCTATITMPTISVPTGFTRIGWSGAENTHTATYTSGQSNVSLTMDANKSFYAQSSKAAISRTITFYKNGNTSFTYSGTTYTDTSKSFTACTIPAVYNGDTQGTSCSATINMPTITAASGFTNIGWSTASDTHTAAYTSGQANVSITMDANKSFYAQSSKAAINRTITFYRNGNTSFTYSGTTYTDTSKSFTACTIAAVYNGDAQNTSCSATITMPTITAASGFNVIGWSGATGTHTATYTSGQTGVSLTMDANKSYYAQSSKAAVNRTITFYRNGNTSFRYNGTTYTDTSKSFTACTIAAVYNGDAQNTSCSATITMPTITAASGFTNIGWSSASDEHTATYTSGQLNVSLTMDANKSFYAQSSKAAINRTITFYNNGNTSFTYNGTAYTDTSKTFTICTIPAVYNGATQGTSCTATVTMPTITAPAGFTSIGWSGATGTHTATYTSGQSNVSLTMTSNMSLYAQSSKAAVNRTITFYKNGNTNFKYNGTTYTDDSKTFTVCTIAAVYNGESQSSSCSATITMPTITSPTGYNQNGWGTASDSTSPTYIAGQSATISMNSNKSYYALKTLIAVNTPTISGGGTYIYSQPVTLTCSTTSTYSTGTTLYYSFGYASSDGGTPSNWSTANTSSTYTFTIATTTPRYYSCKIYATDGTQTTETVTSSADADAEVATVNARVDFDATTNGGTLSGTTPRYVRYNNAAIYANRSGANTGTVPTATKTGWTFNGWYTSATGGNKVIDASGTVQPNVSGWTNSNGRFILTNPSNTENTHRLYAQFTGDSITATFYYNSNTTNGSLTAATATSSCTVESGNSCTVEVPQVVRNSVGKYNSAYKGVTSAINSMGTTSLAISSNTTFYANYSSPITIYYPNSSNTVSSSNTSLYRNEYFTNSSATATSTLTSNANSNTTQATSVTLSNSKGTFQGLETSANTYSNKYGVNNTTYLINTNRTTYYAVVTATENAVIRYNSNTTSGSFTNSSANAATTSTYYCSSTSAMGTVHGTTTSVPSEVSSSVGKYNSAYKGISSSSTGITNVTTFTGGSTYYAYYSSPITIYYPNTSNGVSSSNTSLYRNEYYSSTTAMTAKTATSQTSTTQATSITLSNLKGTFAGLETSANNYSNKYAINNDGMVVNTNRTTYYAVTTGNENVSFVYNSNTTSGSLTASTDTSTSVTSTYYCSSTSAMGTSHGTTTTVPTVVSNSVGKYNSPYLRITNVNSMTAVTTFSGGSKYYAAYSKNNSSKGVTIYYPTSTTARSSETYYRNEFFTSDTAMSSILNTTQAATTNFTFNSSVSGYDFYGFANTYSNNTRDYTSVAALANSDKTTSYAILYKSVTATFYYNNSGNTCGTTTIASTTSDANQYVRCTSSSSEVSNAQISIPTSVSDSKGPYNGTYLGVAGLNSMTSITPTTASSNYYALYRTNVTNYYYGSSYTNRSLYRNEFFISNSAMNAVLATTDASDQTANYTTSGGPNGSTWHGLADTNTATRKYSSVSGAATSNTCTTNLYTIYNYNINYSKGSNVSSIGATTGSCQLKHGNTSCSVTLPTITPNTNYMSVGWNTTSGATTGTAAGESYTVSTNSPVPTLYANAVLANYLNTSTNTSYNTLKDAFSAVSNNQTIKVMQNTTETALATLGSNKTGIKLDLNGKTITLNNTYISNSGTLDIYNTSSTTGTITGGTSYVLYNNGTLTLNGTSSTNKIVIDKTSDNAAYGSIHSKPSGTLIINNNVEVKTSIASSSGIYNEGTLTVTGGTITGLLYGINNFGAATISGGTITGSSYGISNNKEGQLNISGSSTQITGSSYGIQNTGTTTMSGGTITGSSYGICNTTSVSSGTSYYGTVTITGGTIESSADHGVYVASGTTVTLGTKDSNVSTSSPLIQTTSSSNKYGVYVDSGGTLNFYDGIIKSSSGTGYSIYGTVADTPDGYSVYKETANGVESAYLVGSYLNTSTNVSYATLNDAFSAVASNQTIKVMKNTTETTQASLSSGKTGVKLDLNGKTITMDNKYINNEGTLDIYNTSSTTGTITGGSYYVLYNDGILTLNVTSSINKIVIDITSNNTNCRAIANKVSKSLIINNNVEIKASGSTAYGISNSGTATINGVSITSTSGIDNQSSGQLNISGSSTQIIGTSFLGIANYGTTTITGGSITGENSGISNSGTLTISGSSTQIIGTSRGIFNSGTATISEGTITGTVGINNGVNHELNISGSSTQIIGTSSYGIDNSGIITMSAGTITGNSYGIRNSSGTANNSNFYGNVTITGGTIQSSNNHGIYVENEATLTLGTKDSTLSTSNPLVQTTGTSSYSGVYVYNDGIFNFYDGIIKSSSGTGYAIDGSVSDTPTGYSVYKETTNGVESAYLIQPNYTNTTTNTSYTTLNDAFSAVASNQTIKVMQNTTETTSATLASTKTGVTLDLNGKTITSSASPVITNSGTLTITNTTTGNGVLQGSGTNTLTNSGTLYIKGDSSSKTTAIYNTKAASSGNVLMNNSGKTAYLQSNAILKTTEYQHDYYRYVVNNYGILNIDGASIMGNEDSFDNGVQNYSTVNMSSGLIDAETEEGVGIEGVDDNVNTQNVTITGGLIKGNEYAIAYDGNNNSKSTVTIGINDGTTSITTPELRANNFYAIAVGSNKTFNFYDGIIKSSHGTGYAINRTPDNVPTGYTVYKETVSGVESAYLTNGSTTNTYTATFVYNSNTTAGSFTKATTTATCSAIGTSCTVSVPSVVSSSVGKYNSPYKGVYAGTGNMGSSSLSISEDTTYYANYSGQVTENYYNGSSYQNRTLYRNEYFSSASAMTASLATSNTSTTNMTHETGPNSAAFAGFSTTSGSTSTTYSTVSNAALSSTGTLYSVYTYKMTYTNGGNTTAPSPSSCRVTNGINSCSITIPYYSTFYGYENNGIIISSTNENVASGSSYSLTKNESATTNASLISNPTEVTIAFKAVTSVLQGNSSGDEINAGNVPTVSCSMTYLNVSSGSTLTIKNVTDSVTFKATPKSGLFRYLTSVNAKNIKLSCTKSTGSGGINPTADETFNFKGWKYSGTSIMDSSGNLKKNVSGYTDAGGNIVSPNPFASTSITFSPDYSWVSGGIMSPGGGELMSIGNDIVNSVGSVSKSIGVSVKPMMKNDDVSEISSTSKFLGTELLRGEIRSIKFEDSLLNHKSSDKNTWDVSNTQDGSILLWVDKKSDGYYDITIGQEGGVSSPSNAKYLFAYLNNLESIDLTNFDTSNALDTTDMFYGCSSLNKQNIKEGV